MNDPGEIKKKPCPTTKHSIWLMVLDLQVIVQDSVCQQNAKTVKNLTM